MGLRESKGSPDLEALRKKLAASEEAASSQQAALQGAQQARTHSASPLSSAAHGQQPFNVVWSPGSLQLHKVTVCAHRRAAPGLRLCRHAGHSGAGTPLWALLRMLVRS